MRKVSPHLATWISNFIKIIVFFSVKRSAALSEKEHGKGNL